MWIIAHFTQLALEVGDYEVDKEHVNQKGGESGPESDDGEGSSSSGGGSGEGHPVSRLKKLAAHARGLTPPMISLPGIFGGGSGGGKADAEKKAATPKRTEELENVLKTVHRDDEASTSTTLEQMHKRRNRLMRQNTSFAPQGGAKRRSIISQTATMKLAGTGGLKRISGNAFVRANGSSAVGGDIQMVSPQQSE